MRKILVVVTLESQYFNKPFPSLTLFSFPEIPSQKNPKTMKIIDADNHIFSTYLYISVQLELFLTLPLCLEFCSIDHKIIKVVKINQKRFAITNSYLFLYYLSNKIFQLFTFHDLYLYFKVSNK